MTRGSNAKFIVGVAVIVTAMLVVLPGSAEETKDGNLEAKVAKIWWNSGELAVALNLSTEQRSSMDEIYRDYLKVMPDLREKNRTRRQAFTEALVGGDLDAARLAAAGATDASAEMDRKRSDLKIKALEILSPEQRADFGANHADILRSRWTQADADGSGRSAKRVRGRVAPGK